MRLIINVDDYAISLKASKGAIKAVTEGIATDMSVFANSPCFDESAKLAKSAGISKMGVHLTLTIFSPVSEPNKVKSLINHENQFYKKPFLIPDNYSIDEVGTEFEAQIQRLLSNGIEISHLDSHHALYACKPDIMDVVIKLSKKYHVPIRNDSMMAKDAAAFGDKLKKSGVGAVDSTIVDLDDEGSISKQFLFNIIDKYKDKPYTIEIPCHAGYADLVLSKITSFVKQRETDLNICLDKEVKEYILNSGIEMINFSQL